MAPILGALLAGLLLVASCHGIDFGVGFHLSLDYGVASVYCSNGSYFDVAKISGGDSYRQLMRTAYTQEPEIITATAQVPFQLQSIRDHLPRWLGGKRAGHPLTPMLHALKISVEGYLQTTIADAEVILPFRITEDIRQTIISAAQSVSLRLPLSAQPPAGIRAAQAYGIGTSKTASDGGQLVVTVEYSRAALTAMVVHEEAAVFEELRVLHRVQLGQDHAGTDAYRDKLDGALRELVRLPLDEGSAGDEPDHFSNLVLLGESAEDLGLRDALKKVLGERFGRRLAQTSHIRNTDPLFAASRGLAYDCWDRLNFRQKEL